MRARHSIFILTLLCCLQFIVAAGHVWRSPAPVKTFHDYDEIIVKYPPIMRGDMWSYGLPVFELVPKTWSGIGPAEVYDAMRHNPYENLRSYKTTAPIAFVVSSIIPAVFGLSLWTIRLGGGLQLVICILCIADIGRRIHSRNTGVYAAILFSVLPVTHQSILIGIPTLGNMTGISIALWAIIASAHGKRWILAAFAGASIALSTRWGESVGDALACLAALAGPALIASLLAITQIRKRGGWQIPLGLGLAATTGYKILDRNWLQDHTEKYVLAEAGFKDGLPSSNQSAETITAEPLRYLEALSESLMLDHHATVCLVGCLVTLLQLRKHPLLAIVISSPLGAWFILNSATKAQDFYAAPMIPALALMAGVGLHTLIKNKWFIGIILGWLSLSWLLYSHTDIPSVRKMACTHPTFGLATRDAAYCTDSLPHRTVYQWFRSWRLPPGDQEIRRRSMANWLLKGAGRAVFESLPKDSMIMLSAPPGDDGDVLAVLIPAIRPDILVHRSTLGPQKRLDRALMAHFDPFYAVSFNMPGTSFRYQLPNWIVIDDILLTTDWLMLNVVGSRELRLKGQDD